MNEETLTVEDTPKSEEQKEDEQLIEFMYQVPPEQEEIFLELDEQKNH